jgi:hypothetical protein
MPWHVTCNGFDLGRPSLHTSYLKLHNDERLGVMQRRMSQDDVLVVSVPVPVPNA